MKTMKRKLCLALAAVTVAGAVCLGAGRAEAAPSGLTTVLSVSAPGREEKTCDSAVIDYSNAKDGYVMVKWTAGGTPKLKVLINAPGGATYQYNLRTDGQYEAFPLSAGSGSYTVGVYKNTSGTEYATILSLTADFKLSDEFAPFVRPNQYVNYSAANAAVAKAAELCAGITDNLEKVEKVYNFVVTNTSYDSVKAGSVKSGYLPVIDDTLKTGKGICFDYASLMSAMLRSQGVPVKLVVGYAGTAYHAWINVWSEKEGWVEGKIFFDGKDWKLMDPTFASSSGGSDAVMQYIGDGNNYSEKYRY